MLARLASETDLDGFRAEARALLARLVPPEAVQWTTSARNDDLFAEAAGAETAPTSGKQFASTVPVPASFVQLCASVGRHREPQRFALLYRLLWRLVHEPSLRHDPIDADMLLARRMAHAVNHDIHKMRAFVRFRTVQDETGADPLHVAWFEPEHRIVEANAPWFMRRFTQMRWAILTPEGCVEWDRQQLRFGPGASRDVAPPADAGEQLWLTYYQSIFNPARLKLKMMQKEMPRRYWHNLPEAQLIGALAAQASERSGSMIEQPATLPARRIPAASVAGPATLPAIERIVSLNDLAAAAERCRRCPIGACATQAVPGEGPLRPALMLVGEQPGDQEDLRGRPFVGPAGQLLERALQRVGLPREQLFVTNAVRHFKFELRGKRRIHKTPSQQEAAACAHWLEEEIALVQPQALVALGATAARSLLQRSVPVTAERGQWQRRPDGREVLVTLHPSALLRMPAQEQPSAFERFAQDLAVAAQPMRRN